MTGRWQEGRYRPWLRVRDVEEASGSGGAGEALALAAVRWRDGLVGRLPRLYGERAPLVAALLFARREGMDPEVREAFAVGGIAHLLAISGFHVGVIAGMALTLLMAMGVSRRRAAVGAAGAAWGYVGLIGSPDAACRAALILALVAASRARGRPPARWGALAVAGLVLLLWSPSRASGAGFQLSFAGAAGLVAWAGPLTRYLEGVTRRRLPRSVTSALAAGVAATVATLPIVAWHFERVSVVGIPMTLLASPLVSLALPGALVSVALDPVSPGAAVFLAGGVDVVLAALVRLTNAVAAWPAARLWTTRPAVMAGVGGVAVASWIAKRPGIGGRGRRRLMAVYVATALVAWPLAVTLPGRGTLELYAMDVGQGDAIGLRTPRGRWLVVDAGPPGDGPVEAHPAVRALRERGVSRLEALILTHPDADHFGGAGALLESFPVGRVLDPLLAAPKGGYLDLLGTARARGVPWSAARAGRQWTVDGVSLTVLHPPDSGSLDPAEANDASVVLLVEWEGFRALLTGDADAEIERAIAREAGDVDVLKVGHHGSETSTDPELLAVAKPELAVISVGRGNRYGHPAPGVVARLEAAGARIFRTDVHGGVRLVVRRGGEVEVRTER
ncbi:MAG: DNA internalization-related competence protein ComEC/Rec2 [Longimicrobiales bacterium]|nr:DNA internalization-related competence protein ComEC/Rec2 [Longimicrobiales bacterium]